MWRWPTVAAGLGLAALCAIVPAWPVHAGPEVAKLRLATEAATPPLTYVGKDGRLAGFDVDIGNALCAAIGAECEWFVDDFDDLVAGLNQKRYDAIVSSLPMTEKRRQQVDFTRSYHLLPASFVGSEALAGTDLNKETLKGKTIGVAAGSLHERFLTDNFGDIALVKPFALVAKATLDLVGGRLELVFGDRIQLENGFLKTGEGKGFRLLGPNYTDAKWFGDGAGIAVRKGDIGLRWKLDAALNRIRADGIYKKINDRYFEFDIFGS